MSCVSIKRALPPAPEPTRPYHGNYIVGIDGSLIEAKPASPIRNGFQPTEQSRKNSGASQYKKARAKWDKVVKMARAGWSEKEIAEAVGYSQKYVHDKLLKRLAEEMKNEG